MTTPFTRTETAQRIRQHLDALRIIEAADIAAYNERLRVRYTDAVTRLTIICEDLELTARCLDNAPQPDDERIARAKRTYRGKGQKVRSDKGTKRNQKVEA